MTTAISEEGGVSPGVVTISVRQWVSRTVLTTVLPVPGVGDKRMNLNYFYICYL